MSTNATDSPVRAREPHENESRESETTSDARVAVWNDILAEKFVRFRDILVRAGRAHASKALDEHPVERGEGILDVGCGFGESSIDLAGRVGGEGSVLGMDFCKTFIDVARADAATTGLQNLSFTVADAETAELFDEHDLVFSQYGTMFFANASRGMMNLRRALRPGGRLLMLVWQTREKNAWLDLATRAVQSVLPKLEQKVSCGPGPFSMADPERVRKVLAVAGFESVEVKPSHADVDMGTSLDEAIAFQLAIGPAGELMRFAGSLGDELRPKIVAELETLLRPHLHNGRVWLGSSSWTVTAVAPGG